MFEYRVRDAQSRTVRFRVFDYLVSTNKLTGGNEYKRLEDALERLRGTSIKTNIMTGGQRVKEGFGIVDSWKIIEKSPTDEKMIAVDLSVILVRLLRASSLTSPHPERIIRTAEQCS